MNLGIDWNVATFGVAGNFTGHLEQANEASDFVNVKTKEANAPKAIFPTHIPVKEPVVTPEFLSVFPFSDPEVIEYPEGQDKVQIEPECAVLFDALWEGDTLKSLIPLGFGASNDCSIRREGARKISLKKNWCARSKGFSADVIPVDSFTAEGNINDYRIASYLLRDGKAYPYGEDSAIRDYSYVYDKLIDWMLEKFNGQADEGPAEDIHSYLVEAGRPGRILVSIGATRYTEFGESNFLHKGDHAVVILYPESKYTADEITNMLESGTIKRPDISVLDQEIIEG
ncbi:MAG: DUF5718 family protein [Saccharofermentans sp.]|nr:DUF5718 family protein [Saccharofermentans sp.]